MLGIAAREADIIGIQTASVRSGRNVADPSGLPAATVAERIGWVRQQAGARFDQIELSIVSSVIVADDRREAAERLVRERGWQGLSVERVFEMQKRRERYGISYYVVSDRRPETVAPIVARLAGG
jgi:alkanesulfonate monooxygenase SsuD/methylene tetrahydromethanopterin reductase-like flavin-dependent oxidoreductase (luciferase family)